MVSGLQSESQTFLDMPHLADMLKSLEKISSARTSAMWEF
jgi:hypothetical protein